MKRGVLANYASQIYATLLGIVIMPVYLKLMGAEAIGLIGLFASLQVWLQLLDLGVSQTLAREASRAAAQPAEAAALRALMRTGEMVFASVATLFAIALIALSEPIVTHWLNVRDLDLRDVSVAIELSAVAVGCRWVSGLYRGVIMGLERLEWISAFNAVAATVRFVAVVPILAFWSASTTVFFALQLTIALVEVAILRRAGWQFSMPRDGNLSSGPLSSARMREALRFSAGIAFTAGVWTVVTQADRMILAKILPLAEYGAFTLAALAASGLTIISGPISTALTPRMASLHFSGNSEQVLQLYRTATQWTAVAAVPTALVLGLFAEPILWAWTGDRVASRAAAPILTLYAFGNGVLALCALAYYLQYAKGNLRLHIQGNLVLVFLLVPLQIWATLGFGAVGAGAVWFGLNSLYLLLWVPYVHRHFAPGLHRRWLLADVGAIALPALLVVLAAARWFAAPVGRLEALGQVAGVWLLAALAACLGSSHARAWVHRLGAGSLPK